MNRTRSMPALSSLIPDESIPAPRPRAYVVRLSDAEVAGLRALADARNGSKVGVPNHRIDPKKADAQVHYEGLRAEYAVSKVLRCLLDISVLRGGDDHTRDLTLPGGKTVSVKYRDRRGWAFALASADPAEFRADIGVLVWPAGTEAVELVGWMSRERFVKVAQVEDYGYGPRLKVEAYQMASITDLLLDLAGYRWVGVQ